MPARIQQRTVERIGQQVELTAEQNTAISVWSVYVPAGTEMTAASRVTDAAGRVCALEGDVADRPDHRPQFRVAAARLISDMQN